MISIRVNNLFNGLGQCPLSEFVVFTTFFNFLGPYLSTFCALLALWSLFTRIILSINLDEISSDLPLSQNSQVMFVDGFGTLPANWFLLPHLNLSEGLLTVGQIPFIERISTDRQIRQNYCHYMLSHVTARISGYISEMSPSIQHFFHSWQCLYECASICWTLCSKKHSSFHRKS